MPVISYPKNQKAGVRGVLRVDRKFKSHGPQELRREYKKRVAVERVFSRLKNLAGYDLSMIFARSIQIKRTLKHYAIEVMRYLHESFTLVRGN